LHHHNHRDNIPNMTTNPLIPPSERIPDLPTIEEMPVTLAELIERDYHSLKAACAVVAWDAGACDPKFMSLHHIERVLKKLKAVIDRDDIKEMLSNQVAPDGSRRRP